MSRTYRRSGISDRYHNLEAWEAKEIEYETRQVSMWSAAQIDHGYHTWRAEKIEHYQDEIANGVNRTKRWFEHFRDGKDWRWVNSSLGQAFRKHCNEVIRTKGKALEKKLVKDPELYEYITFPDKHITKYLYWCYD